MRQLLVEITSQSIEFFSLAKIFGCDSLIEFDREGSIVRPARFIGAKMARALRLPWCLGIAHVGIVGRIGSGRLGCFGCGIGHVLGGHVRVLHAHPLHLVGIGGFALFTRLLLAAIFLALVFFLLGIVTAILAHLER